MTEATAFVLAGGKSSRMGTDKAFVVVGGRTLLQNALEIASKAAGRVQIVGQPEKFLPVASSFADFAKGRSTAFGEVVPDLFPGCGPLGGIHAALRNTATDLNLVLAVDMPHMQSAFLCYLLERAADSAALVTVPRVDDRFQPLCAVYRRAFYDVAERALREGQNKIGPLFARGITQIVTEDEIESRAFPLSMFENLNTREDLDRARAKFPDELPADRKP